jgi:hypothetical protein
MTDWLAILGMALFPIAYLILKEREDKKKRRRR